MKYGWKAFRRALAVIVGLLCAGYLAAQLRTYWPQIAALDWSRSTVMAFAAAVVLQVADFVFAAWCWGFALRTLGVPASSRQAMSIFCVSQFGKYLPGNVGQHVGRLALTRAAGFQTGRVVVSMFIENGFALGAGVLVAGLGGLLAAIGGGWSQPQVAVALVVFGAGWFVATWALRYLLRKPPARLRSWLALERPIELPASLIAAYFLAHVASYAVMGVVLGLLLYGLSGSWVSAAWTLPVAVTIGWLAGFLTPGAPAGLGVREAVLTSILGASLGMSLVLSAALLWRVSMMLSDVLILVIGLLLREKQARIAAPDGESSR